jgi:hypothetical protein
VVRIVGRTHASVNGFFGTPALLIERITTANPAHFRVLGG